MANGRQIIFVHQAKAAGTSLVEAFKATYGPAAVFHDQDNQQLWKLPRWRQSLAVLAQPYRNYRSRAHYRVIHGHFVLEKYRRAFPDAFYLTFYRNPVQRLASKYHYWLRVPNPGDTNPLRRWTYETRPSLAAFVREWSQVRLLRRDQIKDHTQMDFVGITERLDESMQLLKLHLPELVTAVEPQRVNPDKGLGADYVIAPEDEELLRKVLGRSLQQYEQAVQRFDAEWRAAVASGQINPRHQHPVSGASA